MRPCPWSNLPLDVRAGPKPTTQPYPRRPAARPANISQKRRVSVDSVILESGEPPLDIEGRITHLLGEANEGREGALDEVMELVYDDLRAIASNQLRRRHGARADDLTLQPTALANEAYLRLLKQRKGFDNTGHFFAIATRAMLRVLMDYDRAKGRQKRGGDHVRVTLSGIGAPAGPDPTGDIADFTAALEKLDGLDATTAAVVKLRVLWGLTNPEIASTLDTSLRTVEREWRFARKWLAAEMGVES